MPTNFPTSRDALVNPAATDYMDVVEHDDQHANANDAIEAIQTLLPITSEGSVPRGTLPSGYASRTTDQTGIGTTITDLTSLSVTVTVGTSRRIKVTGHCLFQTSSNEATGFVREGSTELTRFGQGTSPVLVADGSVILTPSAGSHTYKLSARSNTGTINMLAAASYPAFILVEDIGSA